MAVVRLPLDVAAERRCVADLFRTEALERPSATAICGGGQVLTYAELERRSNRLGRYLQELGVGPDVVVGLCVVRSVEAVVAMLGVLKAGGAYLALDPDNPQERLAFMLEDAGVRIVLVTKESSERFGTFKGETLLMEELEEGLAAESDEPFSSGAEPQNLAYVIYTSGSTGTPKGVGVDHRGIDRLVKHTNYIAPGRDDVFLQLAPLSFDASTFEIWGALLNGAKLAVYPAGRIDLPKLRSVLKEEHVTIAWLTAGLFNQIVDEDLDALSSVQQLIAGGEALSVPHVNAVVERFPQCQLINGYGPTEATTFSLTYPISDVIPSDSSVPIGRPIANTHIYVLDEWLEPVPVGVAGELYIGGVGLARGYLQRPGLTAERFMASPFKEGERVYRSGDLARYREDGNLEYLGRVDHQVKIRGFRIELGEIEAALLGHEEIEQAVVLAREDEPGQKRLVAYVVGAAVPAVAQLRAHLGQTLPEYMVPAAFVTLPSLPLTVNGKVDRKALPAPEGRPQIEEFVPPRTPVEEALAAIWAQVLGVERVGIHDNFFELGGHSLHATRVIARVREVFEIELPLATLFEAPLVGELAQHVETAQREQKGVGVSRFQLQPRSSSLPLSFAQERLWFLEQLGFVGAAYNISSALRIEGALSVDALQRSFEELVRRHESLRTRFATVEGRPVQLIEPPGSFALPCEDLRPLATAEQALEVGRLARHESQLTFDLTRGPLLRVRLLQLAEQEHVLLMTVHHIVSDGWSSGVLLRELAALYRAFVHGEGSPLPALPLQYVDYALWQRSWLQGPVLEAQLDYWQRQLQGAPPVLQLPTDRPRPPAPTYRGAMLTFELPAQLSSALAELGRSEGATLFMVLLAAFQWVLSRWSGQQDIVVGTPIAGRTHRETEGLIGLFLNMLALRTDVSGDLTFRQLLERVKGVALGAYAHQDVPFESLVAQLHPERDLSRQPVFQVTFSLQALADHDDLLHGLSISDVGIWNGTTKFDLTISAQETQEGLRCTIEYASELFDSRTMERLALHFRMLLEGVVREPEALLREVSLLSEEERRQLEEWNATQTVYPQERCVHELVSAQARERPDAEAVSFEGERLTYGELERRANRLAHHLRELGVGPEVVVGLCMERSVSMVVGLLGILKAGGAYLPLDPHNPEERLSFMLGDAEAPIVLTQTAWRERLKSYAGETLCVEELEEQLVATQPDTVLDSGVGAQNLAYVIYTSGSTGTPKGVMVGHAMLLNHMSWLQERVQLQEGECVLQKTAIGFDASLTELVWPLMVGARVVLARPEGQRDPSYLVQVMRAEGVTVLQVVPSLLRTLVAEAEVSQCKQLRQVLCAGEALPRELVEEFAERLKGVRLENLYGPTEASIDVTAWECGKDAGEGPIPIGRPIANTHIYVLDEWLEPVPVGVAGELYIGGVGLARGYLQRPGLTAERFMASPFKEGERVYRSGDLARYREDGNLEYLGRVDHQVKIRGFRIELGEIEAALLGHEEIEQAVVLAREDEPGQKRLVAYVVGAAVPAVAQLRAHLGQTLPEYMVPAAFVTLPSLPLTVNGKVDRKALPAPEGRPQIEEFVPPRTPVEEALAAIWAQVLGVERVGIHDNYFELGGDSIQSIRIVARANQAGIKLAVHQIFEQQTIAELAKVASIDAGVSAEQGRVEGEVPLTPIQRHFFAWQPEGARHYNQGFLLQCRERLSVPLLQQAMGGLVEHHDALRLCFERTDGTWRQHSSAIAAPLEVELLDLSQEPPQMRSPKITQVAAERQRSLDLGRGPLLRVVLFDLGTEESMRLLLIAHHLVVDAVSWGVLLEDLQSLYEQLSRGEPMQLPRKTTSFKEWSQRLVAYSGSAAAQAERTYWGSLPWSQLEGLPRDRGDGVNDFASIRHHVVRLSEQDTQALLQQVPAVYHTQINDVLLAAVSDAFTEWTGGRSLLVHVEGHGREELFDDVDLSRTVGWFTSLYPVVLPPVVSTDKGQLLKRVKEVLRAIPHHGIGYGILRHLGDAAELRQTSRPELSFNYLGQLDQDISGSGWLRPSHESIGPSQSSNGERQHLIEIDGGVMQGRLQMTWTYSASVYDDATIRNLGHRFIDALSSIVAHCQSADTTYTPSDFPLVHSDL